MQQQLEHPRSCSLEGTQVKPGLWQRCLEGAGWKQPSRTVFRQDLSQAALLGNLWGDKSAFVSERLTYQSILINVLALQMNKYEKFHSLCNHTTKNSPYLICIIYRGLFFFHKNEKKESSATYEHTPAIIASFPIQRGRKKEYGCFL